MFISIVLSAVSKGNKQKQRYTPPPVTTNVYQNNVYSEANILNDIKKNNPDFSEDSFKRFCEMVYIRYLASIMKKDAVDVKGYLHQQLYSAHTSYIDTIKLAGRNIQIENIIVNEIRFKEYSLYNNVEVLKVEIKSRMNQYETDNNGLVISGYRSRVVSKTEILTFLRDNNKLHKTDAIKCQNCMATLPKAATICEYCGAAVKFKDKTNDGWLLSDVRTM